jgi:hypothetical protein
MPSGFKELFENTNERLVSKDVNRLQRFLSAGVAEMLRYMLDVSANDDDEAAGRTTEYATTGTPLRAEVLSGLWVQPVIGSLQLFVQPGALCAIAPDGDADASNYKMVTDAGSLDGSLVMTANATGNPRLDVVECQVTNVTAETDTRDVFDETIEDFTAQVGLMKATKGQLTYTVRLGSTTSGAGFPGVISGWLPLAVALVPAGATTNDAMTFWDVRPLLADLAFAPLALGLTTPRVRKALAYANSYATAKHQVVQGMADALLGSRRVGGRLRRGTPGTDVEGVDLGPASVVNAEHGFDTNSAGLYYLYFATMGGLPRWARYTDAGAGAPRRPRAPRGVPVVSRVAPTVEGTPSGAIAVPDSFCFASGAVFDAAVCVAAGFAVAGSPASFTDCAADGDQHYVGDQTASPPIAGTVSGTGITSATFTLVGGVHFPPNARALLLRFSVSNSALENTYGTRTLLVHDGSPGHAFASIDGGTYFVSSSETGPVTDTWDVWVPLPTVFPSLGAPSFDVLHTFVAQGGAGSSFTDTVRVIGWKIGIEG